MNLFTFNILINSLVKKDKSIIDKAFLALFSKTTNLKTLKEYYFLCEKKQTNSVCIDFCEHIIKRYPSNSFGYIKLSNLHDHMGDKNKAKEILLQSPFSAKIADQDIKKTVNIKRNDIKPIKSIHNQKGLIDNVKRLVRNNDNNGIVKLLSSKNFDLNLEHCLIFAKACQNLNDQVNAYRILVEAQKKFSPDRQLFMRLGEIFQDDKKITSAHAFFKAARSCYPEYGAVRQLSFEIDNNLILSARATLNNIFLFSNKSLAKFLPVINRASPYFPEYRDLFIKVRGNVKDLFINRSSKLAINPSEQVRIAIKNRWVDVADEIIERHRHTLKPIPKARVDLVNSVKKNIGSLSVLFSLATYNDENFVVKALLNKSSINLNEIPNNIKIIEVFIPTVFYTDPKEEKPSYGTVREFLSIIYDCLLNTSDLAIVPRNQWNWRKCDLLLDDAYSISYHTNGELNKNHIHIQESTLAGRCSIDYKGYAGFSSLVDKSKYWDYINDDPDKILSMEKTVDFYIENNISKYTQSKASSNFDLTMDYVFIPMQVTTDIVSSLAHINGISLLSIVADFYSGTGMKVLVKRHPYCKSMTMQNLISKLSDAGKIIVVDSSVHELIKGAKAVITVNSGVGLEAILHGKKVIATGVSEYQYALVSNPKNEDELYDALSHLDQLVVEQSKRESFLTYYVNDYSLHAHDAVAIQNKIKKWIS